VKAITPLRPVFIVQFLHPGLEHTPKMRKSWAGTYADARRLSVKPGFARRSRTYSTWGVQRQC